MGDEGKEASGLGNIYIFFVAEYLGSAEIDEAYRSKMF